MERRLKERITGAAILVMLGVIFIPMILDDTVRTDTRIEETNIPERPQRDFDSRIVPLEEPGQAEPADKPPAKATVVESAGETEAAPPPPEPEPKPEPEPESEPKPEPEPAPEPDTAAGETVKAGPAQKTKPAAETKTATAGKTADADRPEPESTAPATGSRGLPAWVVQIGSFSQEDNARALIKKLRASGYAAFVEKLTRDGKTIYRVRVGPELLRSDAGELKKKLDKELEMNTMVLRYP